MPKNSRVNAYIFYAISMVGFFLLFFLSFSFAHTLVLWHFSNFSTCSIVIWHFQENICTQQIQCKLLELCISAIHVSFFFHFVYMLAHAEINSRIDTSQNIDNTGSFSQYYLLFFSVFFFIAEVIWLPNAVFLDRNF